MVCFNFIKQLDSFSNKIGFPLQEEADHKIDIEIIRRTDNDEMNRALHKEYIYNDINITFIGTSSRTPQQNGRIQRRLATCFEHVHTKDGAVIRRLQKNSTMMK